MEELFVSSLFKILLVFLSVGIFTYAVVVEKDVLKGLLIINILTNYRMLLFYFTDFGSEVMNRKEVIYKIPSSQLSPSRLAQRFTNRTLSYPIDNDDNSMYYFYDHPLSTAPWWERTP